MIIILFIIIGILNLIEASTPLARLSGNSIGSLSSGLQLQSSMSIISRALNLFFLPILGYISDINGFSELTQFNFVFYVVIALFILLSILNLKNFIFSIYTALCKSIKIEGSLFFFIKYYRKINLQRIKKNNLLNFKKLNSITVIAFIPLYISWPVVFLVIKSYPDYRGLILGSTSVINGLNSLLLVLIIDPFLLKISEKKNISHNLFIEQINQRIKAGIISCFLLIIISFLIT